jgi:hypothetical protein
LLQDQIEQGKARRRRHEAVGPALNERGIGMCSNWALAPATWPATFWSDMPPSDGPELAGKLSRQPGAIISTWALHDLGSQEAVANVYARCFETLPKGGMLVNGDFITPEGTTWTYEPGRFEIDRHLDLLREASFADPTSLAIFEPNIENPTAAQNYACLVATR